MAYNNKELTPKLRKLQAEGKKAKDMSKFNAYLNTFRKSMAWHKAHPTGASTKKPVSTPVKKIAKTTAKKATIKTPTQAPISEQTKKLRQIAIENQASA